jgi:hypothetical protein
MEIINSSIEWCQDNYEITITDRKKVSKYDLQCILSRNPKRFVVDMLNEESLKVLAQIKEKIDIPYLEINNIRDCGDNLINSLPNGINTLNIGFNAWNKKIYNLPNSLKSLTMFCYNVDDCMNLPHGLETLKICIEVNDINLSNLPPSLVNLTLCIEVNDINLSNLPLSIKTLKLLNDGYRVNLDSIPREILPALSSQ